MTRDRDPAGRPRNARPRDALGRPLARGQPGGDQPAAPGDLAPAGPEAARRADRLLREGRPFHAHEVLEAAWKAGPAGERDLWQGLAQIAVGLTHACRGNARGAVALLRRGAQRIRAYRDEARPPAPSGPRSRDRAGRDGPSGPAGLPRPYGMDLPAVLATADALADRIERHGLDSLRDADLRPPLLAAPEGG